MAPYLYEPAPGALAHTVALKELATQFPEVRDKRIPWQQVCFVQFLCLPDSDVDDAIADFPDVKMLGGGGVGRGPKLVPMDVQAPPHDPPPPPQGDAPKRPRGGDGGAGPSAWIPPAGPGGGGPGGAGPPAVRLSGPMSPGIPSLSQGGGGGHPPPPAGGGVGASLPLVPTMAPPVGQYSIATPPGAQPMSPLAVPAQMPATPRSRSPVPGQVVAEEANTPQNVVRRLWATPDYPRSRTPPAKQQAAPLAHLDRSSACGDCAGCQCRNTVDCSDETG